MTDARAKNAVSSTMGGKAVLAGAIVGGAVLGVLAMIGRKIAVQAPTALAHDWASALAAEHKAVRNLFDALQSTSETASAKRRMLLAQLKHALAKHALEEENVIYPALRNHGHKGAADKLNADHGYVKQYLYDLEKLTGSADAFQTKLAEFRADITEHMREEEDTLFPRLRGELSADENRALAWTMNKEGFKIA
tara:strand:+ start:713 stop:1294 length:582 start_codon:yes stop_codon:yes gene_type:complete